MRILPVVLFVCLSTTGLSQIPDSVKNYVDTALYIMQTKSLNGKKLDWPRIKDSAYQLAKDAKNYKDAFPAIAYAFVQLKDYHGMVAGQDTFYRYPPPIDFDKALSAGIKKEFLKGPRIVTSYLDGSIAYLRVPGMNVVSSHDVHDKANKLRDSLCKLIAKNPKGIIIDLRMNTGGNSEPMLAGLGPLFHITLLGYGVDRNGKLLEPVRMKNGIIRSNTGNPLIISEHSCSIKSSIPIAVLIGPSTVSSGEILAVYLEQQSNVKTFGEPTPGFCNATEGFLFANDQGYLLLAVNKIANAKKHVFEEMLVRPDVYVKSEDNYDDLMDDPTVSAAMKWLKSKATLH